MEVKNQNFSVFSTYPFQISYKKKEKWKVSHSKPLSLYFFFFLLPLIFAGRPIFGQDWDGVIVIPSEFQALQVFRQSLTDPKGFLRSWNNSAFGVCSGQWVGIKCAQGQVIVIQLPWKQLGGRITDNIAQFRGLRKLSLHDNLVGGTIPSAIGLLPNLRGLQLFNNRFSGSIPPSLSSCSLLQNLDLGNNSLAGVIPATIFNSTKLFRLNLSFNLLSGSIPTPLTQSKTLIFIDLQHNNLSGPIPNTWGENQIQILRLDHNSISGSVPQSFKNLNHVQQLSLSHNQINGPIPIGMGNLSNLKSIDFSFNSINGSLPTTLFNLSSLQSLNFESNNLENRIPESFSRNLTILNLRRNRFTGSIPSSIGNVSTLNQLDLSFNNLTGEIPYSIGDLPNLIAFNVSYNNLSGQIPIKLSRRFNSSSFLGNSQLCGYNESNPCHISPSQIIPFPKKGKRKLSIKDILLIAGGALILVLFLLCLVLLCFYLSKRRESKSKEAAAGGGRKGGPARAAAATAVEEGGGGGEGGGKLVHFDGGATVFTADDLLCATAEIMGKSTYGTVYKATLEDGSEVAVKRLREKIAKGQNEFEAEVNVLGRIRHENLLAMRAYYLGPKGEKLLVFDYMSRGSLATFLHSREPPDTPIDWPTRMRIAKGLTRGLLHLHTHENMIHGNLTSSNVLLDEEINVKISDYGLSRLMTPAANSGVMATAAALGYRAPELSKLKKANAKTDVYSLGVIILELLTGKSPSEATNGVDLPQWVASIVKEEWTNEVFDVELMREAPEIGDELLNALKMALHCVDPSPAARPEVQQLLQQLEEIRPEAGGAAAGTSGGGVGSEE